MPSKKTPAPEAGPADKALKVTARPASFWRGGLQFTREPRVVPLADITPEQAEQIREEPALVVEEIDLPVTEQA